MSKLSVLVGIPSKSRLSALSGGNNSNDGKSKLNEGASIDDKCAGADDGIIGKGNLGVRERGISEIDDESGMSKEW